MNTSVQTPRVHSSAAASMATSWIATGLTVLMLMNAHWEKTTVSSCVSTATEVSPVSVTLAIDSIMMELIAQVHQRDASVLSLHAKKLRFLTYTSLHV